LFFFLFLIVFLVHSNRHAWGQEKMSPEAILRSKSQ
jgi:hypothetical protein